MINKTIAAYFSLACGWAAAQTLTVGGFVTEEPGTIFGTADVEIVITCESGEERTIFTDNLGVWTTELELGDTCLLTAIAMVDEGTWFDTYWGLPGSWLYDTGPGGPRCPVQRRQGPMNFTVTGDGEIDQSIFLWLVPEGEIPCDNCEELSFCDLGDWNGNNLITLVDDIDNVIDGVIHDEWEGTCMWAADMDANGEVTLITDVMGLWVDKIFYGIEFPPCDMNQ